MKRFVATFLAVLTLAFAAAGAVLAADGEEIHWLGDYKEALRVAKASNKPIFMEFRCEA